MPNKFYKKNENDTIWWSIPKGQVGEFLFSFDKKKVYSLFQDYPESLSKEEKKIFDKENPEWVELLDEVGD